jgi:DNA-binding PadR family transcriptional regulator
MSGREGTQYEDGERLRPTGSPLHGVLLSLLLAEHRGAMHGYGLTTLVRRRLGPAWEDLTRQRVYRALDDLEKAGLVEHREGTAGERRGRAQRYRLFSATDRAAAARDAWMESPVGRQPSWDELQAKIAVSRPEDSRRLLRALHSYERSCMTLLQEETSEAEAPMSSWSGLAANLRRAAVDESIQADLRWVSKARDWIEEYVAEHPPRPSV